MARNNCFYHKDIASNKSLIWEKVACLPRFLQMNSVFEWFCQHGRKTLILTTRSMSALAELSQLLTKPWLLVGSGSSFEFELLPFYQVCRVWFFSLSQLIHITASFLPWIWVWKEAFGCFLFEFGYWESGFLLSSTLWPLTSSKMYEQGKAKGHRRHKLVRGL